MSKQNDSQKDKVEIPLLDSNTAHSVLQYAITKMLTNKRKRKVVFQLPYNQISNAEDAHLYPEVALQVEIKLKFTEYSTDDVLVEYL